MIRQHIKTYSQLWLTLAFLSFTLPISAYGTKPLSNSEGYTIIELQTDTLPSLNVARTGHTTLCLNGELTVFGGHTDGFVPTATAEYLSDEAWRNVPLLYPHDHGIAFELRSGKVFLAGGHKEALGIRHLFSAEFYDPASHSAQGFGCMNKKRVFANAIEMEDGQVVISGNWFADDGIEMFGNVNDPFKPNAVEIKEPSVPRVRPYILRVSDDDAIIFGSLDTEHRPIDAAIVDRLNGPSYHEPFLETWRPLRIVEAQHSANHFIGNESEGRYEWLLPVENDETHEVAIARVNGGGKNDTIATFSLLPTQQHLPDSIHGKPITYSSLVCDREREIAYLIGDNDEARIFVVAIPYGTIAPAPLKVYITAPQPIIARSITPVLTADGDLVFAGGHLINNFAPSKTVIRLPLGQDDNIQATSEGSGRVWWLWILIVCSLVCALAAMLLARLKKSKASVTAICEPAEPDTAEDGTLAQSEPRDEALADLYDSIKRLMDEEQLYLNANLRASDVAARVGSNSSYVSAAVNSQCGCSFSQFLIKYRISHAQELMRKSPDSKLSTISMHSGFNSESTFFRVFRSATGMSPKEWLSSLHDEQ